MMVACERCRFWKRLEPDSPLGYCSKHGELRCEDDCCKSFRPRTPPDGGVEVDGCLHAERELICDEVDEYGDRYMITRCKQCGRYFRENEETGEVEILDHETLPDGGGLEEEFEAVGRFYVNLVCPYCHHRFSMFRTGSQSSPITCPRCLRQFPPSIKPDGGDADEGILLVFSAIRRMLQDELISEHELENAPISDLFNEEG